MSNLASSTPLASTVPEQSISTFLSVETMRDLDDGRLTLCTATESNLGDLRETSPARALGMVADARARLDQAERLIREFEARDTLAAIIAEQSLHVEEWDIANLDAKWRDTFIASAAATTDGQRIIVVPQGQDPIERLAAVAGLLNDLDAQAGRA